MRNTTSAVSKTAQVLKYFAQQYGPPGIPRTRLVKLVYMTDVLARQYLGHAITELRYIKDHYGPNARDLPDYVTELVDAQLAEQITQSDGQRRWIRLRDTGRPAPFGFTLGEAEILAYVRDTYLKMDLDEFIALVVKTTDPFTRVKRQGQMLPMSLVDNTARREIGFDLEQIAKAEHDVSEGRFVTLADFANGLRAHAGA